MVVGSVPGPPTSKSALPGGVGREARDHIMEQRPRHGLQLDAHNVVEDTTAVGEPSNVTTDDAQDVD